MISNKPFAKLFAPKVADLKQTATSEPDKLSVKAGRQTLPTDINTVGGLIAALGVSMPDFNYRFLEALENLSIYNSEVSGAVENIISLGNTAKVFPNIAFEDDVSDELKKEMIQRLKQRSKLWYPYSAGLNSLTNDLLGQVAINGALSAEIIPNANLDGVDSIVMVPPKHIRFKYSTEEKGYKVYQELTNSLGMTTAVDGNLLPLNTTTYQYITMRRITEKPYGIPPFLAALENIAISRDMSQNLMYVAKKMGILGFLEVLIKAPKPAQNETEADYFNRSAKYLNDVIPEIEKGLSKGYVAGFENNHSFKMNPSTSNATGAKDLVEINDVKLMGGLKQDPLMFGRNFSTTESLARVVLSKMTTQVNNYQSIVGSFYERLFLLDLQLAGYKVKAIEVTFDPPMVGDKFKDAQAREKEIANAGALYNAGIISQQDRAVELGYEQPDQEEPRALALPVGSGDGTEPTATEDKSKNDTASNHKATSIDVISAANALGAHLPEYPYHTEGCTCADHETASYATGDKDLDRFIKQYLGATNKNYKKASRGIMTKLAKLMGNFTAGGGAQPVVDAVLHLIYREWYGSFTVPQTKIINSFVNSIYTYFRKDSAIFGSKDVPNGAFSTIDFRALDYYKKSDTFYLGKFITDEDLKKKITTYIKDAYLEERLPIAGMDGTLDAFKKEFGDLFDGQDWKLRRVIDTTVAKMRNTAAVSYFSQAEVESYEIVGVPDRLQCDYCKNMAGKTFSVSTAIGAFSNTVQSDPAIVGIDSPFVTSVYKKADEMKALTGAQLQSAGINYPPFHALCRDTVVAIL